MMPHYLVQYRLVKLPDRDAQPDEWSSARSTMTQIEISIPVEAEQDDVAVMKGMGPLVTRLYGKIDNG